MLNVDRRWVRPLPMDVTTVIPNTGGVKVTLIEANHCMYSKTVDRGYPDAAVKVQDQAFSCLKGHKRSMLVIAPSYHHLLGQTVYTATFIVATSGRARSMSCTQE
jgi:hypothetical protein